MLWCFLILYSTHVLLQHCSPVSVSLWCFPCDNEPQLRTWWAPQTLSWAPLCRDRSYWDFRARCCSGESGTSWVTEPLALMALLHLLCLQAESELHRKHMREAWGDQLRQQNKVWGWPWCSGHWEDSEMRVQVEGWHLCHGAAARKGTVNKTIQLAGVCSVDFLSQKLFLCRANMRCCFLVFGKGRGDQTWRKETWKWARNSTRRSAGKKKTRGKVSAREAASRDVASTDRRTETAGDKGNPDFLLIWERNLLLHLEIQQGWPDLFSPCLHCREGFPCRNRVQTLVRHAWPELGCCSSLMYSLSLGACVFLFRQQSWKRNKRIY